MISGTIWQKDNFIVDIIKLPLNEITL